MKLALALLLATLPGWTDVSCSSEELTFITCFTGKEGGSVVAVDRAGKIRWRRDDVGVWPRGLAASRRGIWVGCKGTLVELNRSGRTLRTIRLKESRLKAATGIQILSEGRFLISDYDNLCAGWVDERGTVDLLPIGGNDARMFGAGEYVAVSPSPQLEIRTKDGAASKSVALRGAGVSVEPLKGGNFLIALYTGETGASEVRPDGTVEWRHRIDEQCYSAQRLRNGHTLLGCWNSKSVLEVNSRGNVVWSVRGLPGGVRAAVRP